LKGRGGNASFPRLAGEKVGEEAGRRGLENRDAFDSFPFKSLPPKRF
jgi:hypothetical protein